MFLHTRATYDIVANCACLMTETVPVRTVNRQCSSGLQAVADVVASIRAGFYDIGELRGQASY